MIQVTKCRSRGSCSLIGVPEGPSHGPRSWWVVGVKVVTRSRTCFLLLHTLFGVVFATSQHVLEGRFPGTLDASSHNMQRIWGRRSSQVAAGAHVESFSMPYRDSLRTAAKRGNAPMRFVPGTRQCSASKGRGRRRMFQQRWRHLKDANIEFTCISKPAFLSASVIRFI